MALDRAQTIARKVHDLSHRLHPAKLRLIGLVAALSGLQRELSRNDIEITFAHDNVPAALPQDLTSCLFRVVQEGLQNAVTHSAARAVSVHLTGRDNTLALTIVDDGNGFDVGVAWGKGLGLISMHERLEAIGGTLTIHSRAGAGTRLEIIVPLARGSDHRDRRMTVLKHLSRRWWSCLMVAACSLLGPAGAAAAADGQKQVLVLYSTRRDAQISIVGDRELPSILEEGLGQGLDYSSEYIDLARFPDPGYQATLRRFPSPEIPGTAVRPGHRDSEPRHRVRRQESSGDCFRTPRSFS